MYATHAFRPVAVLAVLVPIVLLVQGCASWREVRRATPTQYLTEHQPKRVRLTVGDTTLVLRQPRVSADSVVGIEERGDSLGPRRSLPESRIRGLAVRGPNPWPMRVAAGASAAFVVLVAVLLIASDGRDIK